MGLELLFELEESVFIKGFGLIDVISPDIFHMQEELAEFDEDELAYDPYLDNRAASDGELGFHPARPRGRRLRDKTRVLGPLPHPGRRLRDKQPPTAAQLPPSASLVR